MIRKLRKLTREQEAWLPVWRDRWIDIGLSCEPASQEEMQAAIDQIYRDGGLLPPSRYIHLPSPLHGMLACLDLYPQMGGPMRPLLRQMLDHVCEEVEHQVQIPVTHQVGDVADRMTQQVGNLVRDQVIGEVRYWVQTQVGDKEENSVPGQVWIRVGDQVQIPVTHQVGDQVRAPVTQQVWNLVRDQVIGEVRSRMGGLWGKPGYGSHDATWLCYMTFFSQVCKVKTRPFQGLEMGAKVLGWYWPFKYACIITPKPSALHRDANGRLHNEHGPAVDYNGTFGVWALHGVRVPWYVIESPEKITAEGIIKEPNQEVARVILERMGMERFIQEAHGKRIHHDVDGAGQSRELFKIATPNDDEGHIVVVRVQCPSTGRQYLLRVPPTIETCGAAVAWTFGMDPSVYAPLLET